jgi:two-component system, NarL family, sensor kinase
MKTKCILYIVTYAIIETSLFCNPQKNEVADTSVVAGYLTEAKRNMTLIPDSSFFYADKALKLAVKLSSQEQISKAKQVLGKYFSQKEDFGKATGYFLEALKIEEKRKDERRIASLNAEMGKIYIYLEKFPVSLQYLNHALELYEKLHDTIDMGRTFIVIGLLHLSRRFCEKRTEKQMTEDGLTAIGYYEKARRLFAKKGNEEGEIGCLANIGGAYNDLKNPKLALPYLLKTYEYYKKTNNWKNICIELRDLGRTYNLLKQYDQSVFYLKQCIEVSQKMKFTEGLQFVYEDLAQTYDNAHDYKNARNYYVRYMILRDSIYNSTKSQQIFELETKYQTEKKEKEIISLNLEKKKRVLFLYSLVTLIVFLSLIGIFLVLRNRSRRILAEQQVRIREQEIKQLEKENLLLATQSVLEGEEAERQRLARDLHDGLGGLLSGVKLSLNNMKGNVILTNESVNDFNHAIGLLDTSIKELGRVAHNMMPEVLVKLGLKDALSDFCNNMDASNTMNIRFQFIGEFVRVEQKLEIGVYRIIQELINNAIKHSGANEVIVQMVQETNRLCMIVQDNGKGFDITAAQQGKGIGLNSIRSRVESLYGRIDISSSAGKGSEFIIEFDL